MTGCSWRGRSFTGGLYSSLLPVHITQYKTLHTAPNPSDLEQLSPRWSKNKAGGGWGWEWWACFWCISFSLSFSALALNLKYTIRKIVLHLTHTHTHSNINVHVDRHKIKPSSFIAHNATVRNHHQINVIKCHGGYQHCYIESGERDCKTRQRCPGLHGGNTLNPQLYILAGLFPQGQSDTVGQDRIRTLPEMDTQCWDLAH